MVKRKGSPDVDTLQKGQISRDYQARGGGEVRGAASETAKKFKLKGSGAASRVKKYDDEIRLGIASRKQRRNSKENSGRRTSFDACVELDIDEAFEEKDTATYREVAAQLGMPKSTLHRYATKELDYRCLGHTIRPLPSETVQVKLQIDSAGGHGLARGHGNFEKLKAMMLKEFNILLVQQPGNTPMYNILDLTIWQASQLEVDKMGAERHRAPDLVDVCKGAWAATPGVKILQAFEMRKDCAQEAIETDGWCPQEGKGRGGARRVHVGAAYDQLRKRTGEQHFH